jgi:hypothetical protein
LYNSTLANLNSTQADSNAKQFQNTQDNEFGNGVLASTAGTYQTQALLNSQNQQETQDELTAQQIAASQQTGNINANNSATTNANTINNSNNTNELAGANYQTNNAQTAYQRALSNFTSGSAATNATNTTNVNALLASLNGSNTLNTQAQSALTAGANLGTSASNANHYAYQPVLAANANSNVGNLLQNVGNGALTAQPTAVAGSP